jgi:hypothetical protein
MRNQNEPEQTDLAHTMQEASMSNVDYSKTKETRFYANHVLANVTAFDIRMIMSDVDIDGINKKLVANSSVVLVMSPRLAVFLQASLAQAIQGYEARFGEIQLLNPPPDPVPQPENPA